MLTSSTEQYLATLAPGTAINLRAVDCQHWLFGFSELDGDRRRLQLKGVQASTDGTVIRDHLYVLSTIATPVSLEILERSGVTYDCNIVNTD